jgi:uncharacterized protein (TIGR02271 family)
MSDNIVSAVFDNRSEAEAAARDLRQAGVPDSALSVIARHDQSGGDFGDANTTEVKEKGEGLLKGALAGGGVGALLGIAALAIPGVGPLAAAGAIASSAIPEAVAIGAGAGALTGGLTGLLAKHGVSDEDASYYEDRINNGGTFLSVNTSEAGIGADEIREILHRSGGHNSSRPRETQSFAGSTGGAAYAGESTSGFSASGDRTVAEERIPIVEEELQVGKREVERGGAHIHSHVEETPVSEQVNLREENISIERRPVTETEPLSGSDLDRTTLMQDQDVEMRATAEEAVVAKQAHVDEELIVRKTETDRTENIQDTVRHTEVDVDEGSSRGALFDRDDNRSDNLRSSSDLENERR